MSRQSALAQQKWNKDGRLIKGEEWTARILALGRGPVQIKVASIVLWDMFQDNPNAKNKTALADLALDWKNYPDPSTEDVVKALIAIGYPPEVAEIRLAAVGRSSEINNKARMQAINLRSQVA